MCVPLGIVIYCPIVVLCLLDKYIRKKKIERTKTKNFLSLSIENFNEKKNQGI